MSEPSLITVALPEPAGHDVQALAACETVLDICTQMAAQVGDAPGFKTRVVAWLAEKYLGTSVSCSMPPASPFTFDCMKPGCMLTGAFPCADLCCPKRGS